MNRRLLEAFFILVIQIPSSALEAETVPVRYPEGVVRGFLVLETLGGAHLADGDLIQSSRGDRVTSRLVFHFKDGSIHDETVVFSQRQSFRLVSDHLLQRGKTFPHPMESSIDAATGRVAVRYWNEDGREKLVEKKMELSSDASNGLMLTLLKNIRPETPTTTVSMVAASASPRLVKLVISPAGNDPFTVGHVSQKATRYLVKIEIGGIVGLLAPLLGKKPANTSVWILQGDAPAFVKSEGPLYFGGPIWRIVLTSPVWTKEPAAATR